MLLVGGTHVGRGFAEGSNHAASKLYVLRGAMIATAHRAVWHNMPAPGGRAGVEAVRDAVGRGRSSRTGGQSSSRSSGLPVLLARWLPSSE